MIDISTLTESDIGRWVIYTDSIIHGTPERGRLKSWNEDTIFAVFNSGGDWNRFMEYTGQGCDPGSMRFDDPKFIKIIDSKLPSFWYADRIGEVFEAWPRRDSADGWETVIDKGRGAGGPGYIDEVDCVEVDQDGNPTSTDPRSRAMRVFEFAMKEPCAACGSESKLSWKNPAGYAIECIQRFNGCPMNARTHRSPDINLAIKRWNQRYD